MTRELQAKAVLSWVSNLAIFFHCLFVFYETQAGRLLRCNDSLNIITSLCFSLLILLISTTIKICFNIDTFLSIFPL